MAHHRFRITILTMATVTVTRKDASENPHLIWNAFVDLLASCGYAELSVEQRLAYLVFWYDSEVLNGGHLQYFQNRDTEYLDETIVSLGLLGATCQQQVLREAGALFLRHPRKQIRTLEEYAATAREGGFSALDRRFYDCSPSLQECLERHLKEHQSRFVTVAE